MIISLVAAVGKQRQLSLNNKLPWKIGDDLEHFKNLTLGHHLLMGRKTFQSLGRPLPERKNMIISRNRGLEIGGGHVFSSFEEALGFAEANGETELFVIGGGTVYDFFIKNKLSDRMYLTEIDYDGEADVFFPEINLLDWQLEKYLFFEKNHKNSHNCKIMTINRKKASHFNNLN
jgi:dihydrofolate reductase